MKGLLIDNIMFVFTHVTRRRLTSDTAHLQSKLSQVREPVVLEERFLISFGPITPFTFLRLRGVITLLSSKNAVWMFANTDTTIERQTDWICVAC